MTFCENWEPSRHGRLTHPDELVEAAVVDTLADLTARMGPWAAAVALFGGLDVAA